MVNQRACLRHLRGPPASSCENTFVMRGFGCTRKRLHCGGLSTEIIRFPCVLCAFYIRCKAQVKALNVEKVCGNVRKRAETGGNGLGNAAETLRKASRNLSNSFWQRRKILMESSMAR